MMRQSAISTTLALFLVVALSSALPLATPDQGGAPAFNAVLPSPVLRFPTLREARIINVRQLPKLSEGTCQVARRQSGNGALLIQGNILAPMTVFVGGELLIDERGQILCVGTNCARHPEADGATRLVCPEGAVSPGLINAHDHIVYDHLPPADWGDERFEHRHDWRRGQRDHTEIDYHDNDDPLVVAWTELRQLMSGTTALSSRPAGGGVPGLLRNLDPAAQMEEGLDPQPVDQWVFPLGDGGGMQLETGCGYPYLNPLPADAQTYIMNTNISMHVAEGIDQVAHNEFLCLSGQQPGAIPATDGDISMVHAIALRPPDAQILRDSFTSVIWSPRSNISLYGATAPVTLYDQLGIWHIALSTDWTPSGSMNMLRELECARYYNAKHLDGYFSDYQLWKMATANAAVAMNVDDQIGFLARGYYADVAIYDGSGAANYHRAVTGANVEDTILVLRGGIPVYGDTQLLNELQLPGMLCERIPGGVCSHDRAVCYTPTGGATLADMVTANAESYPLFFCRTPPDEPSCVPVRPARDDWGCGRYPVSLRWDMDQDGVANHLDNCPLIFNPVLPLDGYYAADPTACLQADYDGDGQGDACDPSPLGH